MSSKETLSTTKKALLALQEMQAKLSQLEQAQTEPLAIVGMSCRLPGGANDPQAFWQQLKNAEDAITEVPSSRWNIDDYYDPDPEKPGKMNTRYGGFIDHPFDFDPRFFNISPHEAETLDPQQRLLLEVAWETLEDAQQIPETLYSQAVGVFIGICSMDYGIALLKNQHPNEIDSYFATGNSASVAAGRLSYLLGLNGPAMAVDTACSSSLLAIHLACQSLRAKECDAALVGGVNLLLLPEISINFCKAGMLAADGHCKTFAANADGYVRGEGCGMVMLKRLKDAEAAQDPILAVIRGSAVNQDGASGGLTVPSGPSQQQVMRQALDNAKLKPEQISYIEAHGTGTALGDPIEISALTSLYRNSHQDKPLWVGSVKTNIGHLEAAAGIAGLIKLVLSLQHQHIPPHLNCQQPSTHIDWQQTPVQIPQQGIAWPVTATPRCAGLSSFGFSGTNVHVIVAEAPARQAITTNDRRSTQLLTFSAKAEAALPSLAHRYETQLHHSDIVLADFCAASQLQRSHFYHRVAIVADNTTKLQQNLSQYQQQQTSARIFQGYSRIPPKVVFMFTGQGAQYRGMGKQLYETHAHFKQTLDNCQTILAPVLDTPLLEILYAADTDYLQQTKYAQPALFALEYALAKLWQSWGVQPVAVIGHSLGEYVAACIAGVFTLDQILPFIALRADLMQNAPGHGGMLAVQTDEDTLQTYLQRHPTCVIAAVNAPNRLVISGDMEAIQSIQVALQTDQIEVRPLEVSHAFHSPLMQPILADFKQLVTRCGMTFQTPNIPILSNLTGKVQDSAMDAEYWCQQLRSPVLFQQGMTELLAQDNQYFLEIGPKPVLSRFGQLCEQTPQYWLTSLQMNQDEHKVILQSLAQLYVDGADINWLAYHQDYQHATVALPKYAFLHHQSTQVLNMTTQHDRQQSILQQLSQLVANLLKMDVDELEVDAPLLEMGADSIVLGQAVEKVQSHFGITLSIRQLFEELSTLSLIAHYVEQNLADDWVEAPTVSSSDTPTFPTIDGDSAIERIMAQQLQAVEHVIKQQLAVLNQTTPSSTPMPASKKASDTGKSTNNFSFWGQGKTAERSQLTEKQQQCLEQLIQCYTQKTQQSKQHEIHSRQTFADMRSSLGFRLETKAMCYPIVEKSSQGAYLTDIDNNQYIDISMGFGVHLLGHQPDFIVQALQQQLQSGMHLGPQTAMAVEVAELVSELTGMSRVSFCNSGTEAVMTALRLARAETGRQQIVMFTGAYHGHFDGTLAVAMPGQKQSMPMAVGILENMVADVWVLPYGTDESLATIKQHANELAAVLVEPVQSRQPNIQPKAFLQTLRQITTESGGALIFDEMITGFRTGLGGAQAFFEVQADIATYGKVVGGGMPIGIVAGKNQYMDHIDGGAWQYDDDSYPTQDKTFYAGTFCKHPLTMATARAVLQYLKAENGQIQSELNQRTHQLVDTLNDFFQAEDFPIEVIYFASMFRFTMKGNVSYVYQPLVMDLFYYHLLAQDIYIWEGRTCFLSTAHSEDDILSLINAVKNSVKALRVGEFW